MSETSKISLWVWVSLLLIVGLFVAFILFLDQNIVRNSQQQSSVQVDTADRSKPVFDFYTVLPQRKLEIEDMPDDGMENSVAGDHRQTQKKTAAGRYLLQVGSFQQMKDADRRKAELAMLGFEASISSADIRGVTYYRVEMGPYSDSQYSKVQRELIANDLKFLAKNIQ